MTVRPATLKDIPDIERIFNRCRARALWLPEELREETDFTEESEGEEISVAVDARGKIQGFISIFRPQSFVHHLYVDPDEQNRGIGVQLLAAMSAKQLPLPWSLKCAQRNSSALRFYQRNRWTIAGTGESDEGGYYLLRYDAKT